MNTPGLDGFEWFCGFPQGSPTNGHPIIDLSGCVQTVQTVPRGPPFWETGYFSLIFSLRGEVFFFKFAVPKKQKKYIKNWKQRNYTRQEVFSAAPIKNIAGEMSRSRLPPQTNPARNS